MFCKVCFDSRNFNYNDHNLKDRSGNTICPVLLNTKCLNCGYFGHTSKYCKIQYSKVSIDKSRKFVSFKNIDLNAKPIKQLNTFAILCDDDDDDDDENNHEYRLADIVWGKGTKSLIGINWADYCDC